MSIRKGKRNEVIKLTTIISLSFYISIILMYFIPLDSMYYPRETMIYVAQKMNPIINSETLYIIAKNLLVGFSLYFSSKIIFNLNRNNTLDDSKFKALRKSAILFHLVYFVLLGIRVGVSIKGSIFNNYWFSLLTLIMPHGILEITGLALVSATSLKYFLEGINKEEFINLSKLSAGIIIVAGIVETTLTPFIFSKLVLIA